MDTADFDEAVLAGCDLSGASLTGATLVRTDLAGANFRGASFGLTVFADVDLSAAACLEDPRFYRECFVDVKTLARTTANLNGAARRFLVG